MNWLFENSTISLVLGISLMLVLGYVWLQTRIKPLLWATVATLLATMGAILLEKFVETDREVLRDKLHQIANDLEKNDLDLVLRHIHSEAHHARAEVETNLSAYKIVLVNVHNRMDVEVDPLKTPPQAVVEFTCTVVVSSGPHGGGKAPVDATVTFQQEQGDWKIYRYSYQVVGLPHLRGESVD